MSAGHDALFPPLPHAMRGRVPAALADERLQAFVRRATLMRSGLRAEALPATFGERLDGVRELAARIRQHTLDHLDAYLERFVDRAEAHGAVVHFARDAAQANAIVTDLAREAGARLCVKSKSMVTEEIGLLPALEAAGCRTIETDLGEFILQLDGDAPSHIVTPMIHKDRVAVGRAFERELGVPYTDDPAELTQIARGHLRDRYRGADLGISGANFLVAATGSVVICTNEGNGLFCTTAPPVHVVVAGIEKLVPSERHLAVLLKLLTRASLGQPLTCYTHLVAGPRRAEEHGGPDRLHVVLVDNGRTEVLRSGARPVLRCIRCGACLNACPVYRCAGGHAYGAVYSGPIGAVLTPRLKGIANYPDLPQASSLCGGCLEACPVAIDIPTELIRLRKEQVEARLAPGLERLLMRLWGLALRTSAGYRAAAALLRAWLRFRARGRDANGRRWITRACGPLAAWTAGRDFPAPPRESFRRWWRSERRG